MQCGVWVCGNLRLGGGDGGEQGGLARVRVADEADLGNQAQFQAVMTLVAQFAVLRESGCLPRRGPAAL